MRQLDKDFKFVVVGGGSAGWMSALYLRNYFPKVDITVIASSEIGILGAGEAVAPDIFDFLLEMGIPIYEFVVETDATIKNDAIFTNWGGEGTKYYSPVAQNFYSYHIVGDMFTGRSLFELDQIAQGKNLDELHLATLLSQQGKIPFKNPYEQCVTEIGVHMNAVKAAAYFKKLAIKQGVKFIDAKVDGVESNESGDITNVVLEGGSKVPSDFVFDCSGFRRLIIGEHFKSEWIDYKKHLPVNRAIPWFEDYKDGEPTRTSTQANAMKYGWMWKTPVQGRYGFGYVFDNDFITEEQAKQEIDEYMGYEVVSPKTFRFNPGCYKDTWIKNCIAIGTSSGFVEPLEGTAIFSSIISLRYFVERITYITLGDKKVAENYNRILNNINKSFLEYIQFHYMTKRNDTEFWRTFRTKNELLPIVQELVDTAEYTVPNRGIFGKIHSLIPTHYWYIVGAGMELWKPGPAKALLDSYTQGKRGPMFEQAKRDHNSKILNATTQMMKHDAFLEKLREMSKTGFRRQ